MGKRLDHKQPAKNSNKNFIDGFDSFSAKLGLGQDNMLARSGYMPGRYITRSRAELEDMYRTSWVVARVVEVIAEDMVRSPIEIQSTMEQGDISTLLRTYRSTGIPGRLTDAFKWGRLYGGAIAIILIEGHDLSTPLEMASISKGSFRGLYVLDRYQVTPSTTVIKELGPMLGYPLFYKTNTADEHMGVNIHHSRALRFVGVDLPGDQRRNEEYWGASVVERIYDRILALDSATHGAANLLYKSFLRVIGVDRLRDILSSGGKAEQALHKMFTLIRQMQTNEGMTLLDTKDTFSTHGYNFSGVYEALQAFAEQISGGSSIPLIRLMGQSSKGFSTGESDLRTYYDTILTQNADDRLPVDIVLFNVLSRHIWGKPLPDDFSFEYQDLYHPTELEKSQIATADAQSVAGLHAQGIISTAQALTELKDASRTSGRFSSISDADIARAEEEDEAPLLPEGMLPEELMQENINAPTAEEPTPQEISLNGAQVSSLLQIVAQVAAGELPRESGIQMLIAAFPVELAQAEEIMGEVGKGFIPASQSEENKGLGQTVEELSHA